MTPDNDPAARSSPLINLAVAICVSLGVVLALPNQNITYYDDLSVIALFAYPAFAILIALLVSAVREQRPAHLKMLVACAAIGAFHLTATLLHLTATHELNRLYSSEQPMTDGGHADAAALEAARRTPIYTVLPVVKPTESGRVFRIPLEAGYGVEEIHERAGTLAMTAPKRD